MPEPRPVVPPGQEGDLIKPPRFLGLRLDRQQFIKGFFGLNAGATVIVLFLIMYFLGQQGVGFLPTYQWELRLYRQAGLELCDYVKKPLAEHSALLTKLKQSLNADLNTISGRDRERRDAAYLLKQSVEDKIQLSSENLAAALKNPATPKERLEPLRQAYAKALSDALAGESLPPIFSAAEQQQLKNAILSLQPNQEDLPPFIEQLVAKAAESDGTAKEKLGSFVSAVDAFEEAASPLDSALTGMNEIALKIKSEAVQQHMSEDAKAQLLAAAKKAKSAAEREHFLKEANATETAPVDYGERIKPLKAKIPDIIKLFAEYKEAVTKALGDLPADGVTPVSHKFLKEVRDDLPRLLKDLHQSAILMQSWDPTKPIPVTQALTSFLFGGDWVTNSSWQDFYGMLPLLAGSVLISVIALTIALPFSLGAAIYTNQLASPTEQGFIKPTIEFIQAIPSVVFGFIGISILGDLIKEFSQAPWLSWVPGFPIKERLNMFNAGCLLALMAIPTIFSLAEDAINNVPRAYSEASEALGATRLQTVFRVVVPAATSGILAAILLGLGRIIGETMVVLLVAGNRIAIPDFSDGLGVVFQPAHTLTGIIAQELGEVSTGSSHWQALFMVGILLFIISLSINFLARFSARRFQHAKS